MEQSKNLKAFLDMIADSEGTTAVEGSDDGYNVLVGGRLFTSYSDHPRIKVDLPNLHIYSTAAGRYQILAKYFDAYSKALRLSDFSPASQDAIAIQMIRECGAIPDIEAGQIAQAIHKCRRIWASLPSSGYGQHENKLAELLTAYQEAGGAIAAV